MRLPGPWRTQAARRALGTAQPEYQVFFRVLANTGLRHPAISALAMHCRREAFLEAQCVLAMYARPKWGEYFVCCDKAMDELRKGVE